MDEFLKALNALKKHLCVCLLMAVGVIMLMALFLIADYYSVPREYEGFLYKRVSWDADAPIYVWADGKYQKVKNRKIRPTINDEYNAIKWKVPFEDIPLDEAAADLEKALKSLETLPGMAEVKVVIELALENVSKINRNPNDLVCREKLASEKNVLQGCIIFEIEPRLNENSPNWRAAENARNALSVAYTRFVMAVIRETLKTA